VTLEGVDGNCEFDMNCLKERKFFTHIASVSRWKRQIDSLVALNNLIIEGHDIFLVFAGPINDDPYYEELCEYIHKHRLNDNVRFVGYIDDPAVVLSQSVANLVCSNQEPFGRITIESMAVGVPVIGAAAAGTAEIIQNGVSGLLYPPGDVEALTGQMRRLLLDGALRKHLIDQGKERVEQFSSPEREMEPVLQIMNNLPGKKNPSWPLGQYLGFCYPSISAISSIPSPMTRFRKKYLRVIKSIMAG
jgi:glycosyltransferase involved in cell wall biosynthesis